jgi:hypothetical protein
MGGDKMAKGRQVGAKGKRQSIRDLKADMIRAPKQPQPAYVHYCYGCSQKMMTTPIEREIDGKTRNLCRSCAQKLEGNVIVRDLTGKYRKKKLTNWEIGRREAMLVGAGRFNDIF